MIKYIFIIATVIILTSFYSFGKKTVDEKIKEIDKYASNIDSCLPSFKHEHRKLWDCFGWDNYSDSNNIYKKHNYQEGLFVDFYYKKNKLVLVTIDGSFKLNCAGYCWTLPDFSDTTKTRSRDYKARIYYDRGKILKEIESGTKPFCPIRPNGPTDIIDFDNKAKIFLSRFGQVK